MISFQNIENSLSWIGYNWNVWKTFDGTPARQKIIRTIYPFSRQFLVRLFLRSEKLFFANIQTASAWKKVVYHRL